MADQFVIRRGEGLPPPAQLGPADPVLSVLDAHPNGEGLLLHGRPGFLKHPKGVPRGVARGQDQGLTGHGVGGRPLRHGDLPKHAARGGEAFQAVAEADLSPGGQDLLPEVPDHHPEQVGAHMGLVLPEDVLRSPGGNEGVHDVGQPGVVGTGGELAIGKGTSSPLTELDIGLGIQRAALPKGFHILHPLLHRSAAFQQDGPQPSPGQGKGGKEPCRAASHHHRRGGKGAGHLREHIGPGRQGQGDLWVPHPGHGLLLVGKGDVHRHNIVGTPLLPGIDRLAHRKATVELPHRHPQGPGRLFPQQVLVPLGG